MLLLSLLACSQSVPGVALPPDVSLDVAPQPTAVPAPPVSPGDPPPVQPPADDPAPTPAPPQVLVPGMSWHWQLQGTLDTDPGVDLVDLDLFDTSASTIAAFQANGVEVVCYFSAGAREDWRPDAGAFPGSTRGNPLDGWPGEYICAEGRYIEGSEEKGRTRRAGILIGPALWGNP